MNKYPRIIIDIEKIRKNTETIVNIAKKSSIEIIGVTKATCGDPLVGKAMLDGGAKGLADSRLSNIKRLKSEMQHVEFMLLRSPMISQIPEIIKDVDISINTELEVLKKLSIEAEKKNMIHQVLLMVEFGERREGINNEEIDEIISFLKSQSSLELYGIGMNLTCYSGVIPTEEKINEFMVYIKEIESRLNTHFKLISGGNTANIPALTINKQENRINQLRVGEGILLGVETIHRSPIQDTFQDAFILEVELIEVKNKPNIPDGELTENAFGEKPCFQDIGVISRGIAAIGLQDTILDDLKPCDPKIEILGGSSDHLLLHLPEGKYQVGDTVKFIPKYGALVHLFTSNYVHKTYVNI